MKISPYNFIIDAPQISRDLGLLSYQDYKYNILFHMSQSGKGWMHTDGIIITHIITYLYFYLFFFLFY